MGKSKAAAIVVKPGSRVRLESIDPSENGGFEKEESLALLEQERQRIGELQGRLYGENTRALLVVLQGMDTSGKDGTVRSVFNSVSPVGMQVTSFGPPSEIERDHDFLWRIYAAVPRKGNVGVFNRSHYEEVLVSRVRKLAPESVWRERYRLINEFESLITDLGTTMLKFYLHIDRDEQKRRLEERLSDPAKNWKYQPSDLEDRKLWPEYTAAYEDALSKCSTRAAPWQIVPANKKWYRNLVIAREVANALEVMAPRLPRVDFDPKKIKIT